MAGLNLQSEATAAPPVDSAAGPPPVRKWRLFSLRRVTSSGEYFAPLDGLRFFSILSVMVYHLSGDVLRAGVTPPSSHLFEATQRANFGVQFFFVISGFILLRPFALAALRQGPPVEVKAYYLRRLTRLEPAYLVSLFIFAAAKILSNRATLGSLAPNLLASCFYLHNVIYGRPSDINFVAWSLEVEVQFYLLAPVIAALTYAIADTTRRRVVIMLLAVASSAVHYFSSNPRLLLSVLGQAQFFLAGAVAADVFVAQPFRNPAPAWVDPLAGLGHLLLGGILVFGSFSHWPVLWVLCAPVLLLSMWGRTAQRILSWAPISITGGMCYSIYLVHAYMIAATGRVIETSLQARTFWPAFLFDGLACFLPLTLTSIAFFVLIERPTMIPDWPRHLWARFRRFAKG